MLARDSLLNTIARYIHLEVKEKEDHQGKKSQSETLIFPRYHQLNAVRSLLAATQAQGAGHRYLVQHSAGSGKSNSIAWLSHQLASLHANATNDATNDTTNDTTEAVFNSVIVITDRTVLDNQLQETITSFEHKPGVVVGINREGSNESKSTQLADALERGAKIIITKYMGVLCLFRHIPEITIFPFTVNSIAP